jgi:hypothetical protein
MLVAGSAVFEPGSTEKNARSLLKLARAAVPGGGHAGHGHGAKSKARGAKPAKGKRP